MTYTLCFETSTAFVMPDGSFARLEAAIAAAKVIARMSRASVIVLANNRRVAVVPSK